MSTTMTRSYALYPAMRRGGAVGITHSGGTQRIYSCVCGARHSMCARWAMPQHMSEWIEQHESTCGAAMRQAQALRDAGDPAMLAEEEILLLDGMPTLTASRMERGVPPDIRAYRAQWLAGGQIERGVIAVHDSLGSAHAPTLRAALAVLDLRATEARVQAERERVSRLDAAIREQLSRGDAGDLAAIVVAIDDSTAAGNCATGTRSWIEQYMPGRESATVAEVLACGDRSEAVLRAVLHAVRRVRPVMREV